MISFTDDLYPYTGNRGALAIRPADYIDGYFLDAGAPVSELIPADAEVIVFRATNRFYVKFGAGDVVASYPSRGVSITDGTGSELNPQYCRVPDGATHLSLVSDQPCVVTLSFYKA